MMGRRLKILWELARDLDFENVELYVKHLEDMQDMIGDKKISEYDKSGIDITKMHS